MAHRAHGDAKDNFNLHMLGQIKYQNLENWEKKPNSCEISNVTSISHRIHLISHKLILHKFDLNLIYLEVINVRLFAVVNVC